MNLLPGILKKCLLRQFILAELIILISLDGAQLKERVILALREASSVCEQVNIFTNEKRLPPPVKQCPKTLTAIEGNLEWNKCDKDSCIPFKFLCGKEEKTCNAPTQSESPKASKDAEKRRKTKYTEHTQAQHNGTYHDCDRPCASGDQVPKTCHYTFIAEHYWTMSTACKACPRVLEDCFGQSCIPINGFSKGVSVINRQIPGPPIHVCQNDTIVVDLVNEMHAEGMAIHWHGLHQKDTPWMDGVVHVTQCIIPGFTSFRYTFDVPHHGTYWWHSHAGHSRGDGIFGALIVRPLLADDPYGPNGTQKLYDFDLPEHEMILSDFSELKVAEAATVTEFTPAHIVSEFLLVNGRGLPPLYLENYTLGDPFPRPDDPIVPLFEMRIEEEKSYRIRVIHSGTFMCPIRVSIEDHRFNMIASDGHDLHNQTGDSFVIVPGERWDFVLTGDQPPGSYWIKFQGTFDCSPTYHSLYTLAVLNYDTIPPGTYPECVIANWNESAPNPGLEINALNVGTGVPGESMTIAELDNIYEDADANVTALEVPDHQFFLAFNTNPLNEMEFPGGFAQNHGVRLGNRIFYTQVNDLTYKPAPSPPLTQPGILSEIEICNEDNPPKGLNCYTQLCACVHVIKASLNSVIEIVMIDRNDQDLVKMHPIHFHGYDFQVVGMGKLGMHMTKENFLEADRNGSVPRKRTLAVHKDSLSLPYGGYIVLRARANNPGFWLIHCHLVLHHLNGMTMILQVGEPNEMPKAPADFPTCGNYVPPISGLKPIIHDKPKDTSYQKLDYDPDNYI